MRNPALTLIALSIVGCGPKSSSVSATAIPAAPADPWVITNLDPKAETPALLWNGLIGVRISTLRYARASLYDISSYEKNGEEKIVPLPSPLELEVDSNGSDFSPTLAKDFVEKLDMKTGEIVQSWTQDTGGNFKVEVRTAIHPTKRVIAQKWTIQPKQDAPIRIRHGFARAKFSASSANEGTATLKVNLRGKEVEIRDILHNQSPGEWRNDELPSWNGKVDSDPPLVFETTASLEPTPTALTYDDVAKASADEWEKRWQTDIEIDGPVEDQQAIRSFLFYLRSAIDPDGKMSISPMGLSSDIYNGHVFWDADIWVFPALALIDPEKAKAIPEYRLARQRQAADNFTKWWQADERPTATGKMGFLPIEGVPPMGIKFPWESSVTGKETVPGPSKFEDHITGSVAFALGQAIDLGLVTGESAGRLLWDSDQFYRTRATFDKDHFEIKDTVSPDENHTGNNDLYTNLVAQWSENLGSWNEAAVRETMKKQRNFWAPYKLPKDDKTFLTYDNDPVRGYKQAAAVLSIYPLQYPPAEQQAKAMMDRFADKVTKNGPAMTDSIHSIVWARLGETDKAYHEWRESWQPFMKPPFLLFSEKRSASRTYFTTGAAGSLQAVLYGFAGLRIDSKKAPGAQWSMPLEGGAILSIAPHLPKEWKKLTLKNLVILGKRYTLEVANDKVVVKQGS